VGAFLSTLFAWPNGIVVGNLIASALWATPALIGLHRKLDRHHAAHMAAAARTAQLAAAPADPAADDPFDETRAQELERRLRACEAHLTDLEDRLREGVSHG
jgi:hypothetical protein